MQLMCDPFPHIAHGPAAIPLALSPLNPPPKQTSSNPSTLFPAFRTASSTIPPVSPANSFPQNLLSLPCASRLIPHSPPQGRRSLSRDFVPWRFSDACRRRSSIG